MSEDNMHNNNAIYAFQSRLKVVESNTTALVKTREKTNTQIANLEQKLNDIMRLMKELKSGGKFTDKDQIEYDEARQKGIEL